MSDGFLFTFGSASLCGTRNALTLIAWCTDYGCLLSLRLHGVRNRSSRCCTSVHRHTTLQAHCRLFLRSDIQNHEGILLEANSGTGEIIHCTNGGPAENVLVDSDTVPFDRVRARFHTQCHHLGKTLVGCCTVLHHAGYTEHVVRNLVSTGLPWLLLWLSQTREHEARGHGCSLALNCILAV